MEIHKEQSYKGKYIVLVATLRKSERTQINGSVIYISKGWKKQWNSKYGRQAEIIKIRAQINEIQKQYNTENQQISE